MKSEPLSINIPEKKYQSLNFVNLANENNEETDFEGDFSEESEVLSNKYMRKYTTSLSPQIREKTCPRLKLQNDSSSADEVEKNYSDGCYTPVSSNRIELEF